MNKKGAEMTIGTIIVIILALVVLVAVIVSFTGGWTKLTDKISQFLGGGANVDTVVQACNVACSTNSVNDYCRVRSVKFDDKDKGTDLNCKALETRTPSVGLSACSAITCPTTTGGEVLPNIAAASSACLTEFNSAEGVVAKNNVCTSSKQYYDETSKSNKVITCKDLKTPGC